MATNRIFKITRIFRENGWFNTNRSEIIINEALDRSIEMSEVLNDDQFEMFCILLKNYMFVEVEKYVPAFERALSKLVPRTESNHVYRILPLVAPKDKNKVKSGNNQLYSFAHTVWNRSEKFRDLHITAFLSAEAAKNAPDPKGKFTTLVVDDFIGTGETAKDFLDDYAPKINPQETIVFIALVAMQAGINTIQSLGHKVIVDVIAPRGIGDCIIMAGDQKFYNLMSTIETQINISADYLNGYKKSESLVTMQRTPNNTFPLFWAKKRKDGSSWPSLFPRHR